MEKCIFIGYPPDYKGWKFYNPATKKSFIHQIPQGSSRILTNPQESPRILKDSCISTRILTHLQEFSRILKNTCISTRILDNPQRFLQIPKNPQESQRILKDPQKFFQLKNNLTNFMKTHRHLSSQTKRNLQPTGCCHNTISITPR
jgi:hypothetical protein